MNHELKKENFLGSLKEIYYKETKEVKKHIRNNSPFILKGIGQNWKALKLWNLDYLSKTAGDCQVHCVELDSKNLTKFQKIIKLKFSEFIKSLKEETHSKQKLYLVISSIFSHKNRPGPQLRELQDDLEVPTYFPRYKLWAANLWIGAGNNKSNLHFDPDNNILVPVIGSKSLILISPSQKKFLYQKNKGNIMQSLVDIFNINQAAFPKINGAFYYETTIQKGDGLFIPAGWWCITSTIITGIRRLFLPVFGSKK